MTIRSDLNGVAIRLMPRGAAPMGPAAVDAILDALINRVPAVCPSGFDWTAGDIEDWLRAVREGRA